jgi:maltooligosyltrehalose synthase
MPLIEAISLMPAVWPERNKGITLYFMLNHYYRHKTKQVNAPDSYTGGCSTQTLAEAWAVMAEVFHDYTQRLQENSRTTS